MNFNYVDFKSAYIHYINSEAWNKRRQLILERDNHICKYCNKNSATQVHHLSYLNLGNESDFELLSVCSSCHKIIHDVENDETTYVGL